ncbi:AbrB/MazE/SpoVT family DNA-binding domain-containing protein [Woodsholea maritima]|uniref:hypothetical protein n=1 Tax=Woodsholea maritima TaxID=240237 RepID=UPI00036AB895|nr:hypothetical protein [Woodsholea maritima]
MTSLKLRQIGNSVGVVLPKDILSDMKLAAGDSVHIIKTAEGYRITPYDPEFEEQMEAARETMKHYRNALRELAK